MAKILIVEDSPTQLESIRRIVEKMGHSTVCAVDGEEAIIMAKNHKPDLILMDVIMPNTNGFQATRIISRDPQTSSIPIALVTNKSYNTDKVWGLRQGAKAYLVKPFKDSELSQLIEKLLLEKQEDYP